MQRANTGSRHFQELLVSLQDPAGVLLLTPVDESLSAELDRFPALICEGVAFILLYLK